MIEGLARPETEHSVEGFRGAWFSRTTHCLPDIVSHIWQGRDKAKQQKRPTFSSPQNYYECLCWGSGCRWMPLFDPRLTASITMRGHEIMRITKQLIESQGYQVIYGDTDSTFVWLRDPHTDEQAQKWVINCVTM